MSIRLYTLNGKSMQTRDEVHNHLAQQFDLAAHYGRNLDALWDLLSERGEGGVILLSNGQDMPKELLLPLLGVLTDLSAGDTTWQLKVLSEEYRGVNPLVPGPIQAVKDAEKEETAQ